MANVTRINLTGDYALAVEAAAKQWGVSQAEVTRIGLRALWGQGLENAPGSTGDKSNRSPVQPVATQVKAMVPELDELFSAGA